jgi:hypothetical protein
MFRVKKGAILSSSRSSLGWICELIFRSVSGGVCYLHEVCDGQGWVGVIVIDKLYLFLKKMEQERIENV